MPPFPLLRLPGVVLFDVFKSLNIGEKIKLSLCSKKVSTQINNARLYSQKVIVVLDCSSHKIEVHSENRKDTFEIFNYPDSCNRHNSNTHQFSIACSTVRSTSISIGIEIFWKNNREGFLSVTQHLLKIFQCKISTGIIDCYCLVSLQPAISDLFDLQLEFETFTIALNGSRDKNLMFNQISDKFGLVENLRILSHANPGFIPVFISWPQNIDVFSSAWFTLEYLFACTCTKITLKDSRLKNKNVDEILRKWNTGGFPNLECLKIYSHNITNNESTILGMNLSELNGKVIQTDDGAKKATINTDYGSIEMSIIPFQ
ncbi:hypothetical protein GCK72_003142 [Caenorhabditis remanei]|uniref:F-box domain-containing protein n=1 Tax=Caenorhabditis remanei TaxID=31234 RepID=A0A6A5HWN4_CAERE|nr:hypothetical protein GCK72_003142 [Caenorhabditis remanei]KAF1771316.1 hypothetical protein GCK72_003142 [Caenorhabditis remanei]